MLDCRYPQKNRYCKNRDTDKERVSDRGKNRGRNRQVKRKQRKIVRRRRRNVLNIAPRYILITIHVQAKKPYLLWQVIVHACTCNPSPKVSSERNEEVEKKTSRGGTHRFEMDSPAACCDELPPISKLTR